MRNILVAFPLLPAWVAVMAYLYQRFDPWRFQGTWRSLLYFPVSIVYYLLYILFLVAIAVDYPNFYLVLQRAGFIAYFFIGMLVFISVPALIWFGMKYADPKIKKKGLLEIAEDFLLVADLLLFYAAYLPEAPHPPTLSEIGARAFEFSNPAFTLAQGTFVLFALIKLALLYAFLMTLIFPKSRMAKTIILHETDIAHWRVRILAPLAATSFVLAIAGYLIDPFLR